MKIRVKRDCKGYMIMDTAVKLTGRSWGFIRCGEESMSCFADAPEGMTIPVVSPFASAGVVGTSFANWSNWKTV